MIRRRIPLLASLAIAALALGACADDDARGREAADGAPVRVVATFSILADIATAIGGDDVDVHSIVPLGVDPHEYSPLPKDVQKTTEADVVLWNGLNMEVGGAWFEALIDVANKDMDSDRVVEVSAGVEPMYLASEDGSTSEINPHAFLDPQVGMIYATNIRDGLIAADPAAEPTFRANAEQYLAELKEIDALYRERIAEIPADHRVLVTSEHAFQYMTERYGMTSGYIWEIDTDEQGTPTQMNTLISLVRTSGVPALFVESNVDQRPMQTISSETGVPIYGTVFSDELGSPDSDGGTYLAMLRHNITQIHAGLS